jgi:hypothetical protein
LALRGALNRGRLLLDYGLGQRGRWKHANPPVGAGDRRAYGVNTLIERTQMQERKRQGTMRRGTSTRLVGWSVIVGLALLASCASQSKSAPPPPAEPSQAPAAAESHAPAAPPAEQTAAEQQQPPAPAKETASPPAAKKPTTVELVRQPERSAKAKPATSAPAAKKSGGCGDKDAQKATPTPSPTGPQPHFVCKQSKIEAEPVWQGTDAVFVFEIANEGEGKLDIKIKGG